MEDNWVSLSSLESIPEKANSYHCDTRDFHIISFTGYNEIREDNIIGDLKNNKIDPKYLIKDTEVLEFLRNLENISGGTGDWRYLSFNNPSTGWLKYIRMYRYEDKIVVCDSKSSPIEWRNLTESNLLKEHLGFISKNS